MEPLNLAVLELDTPLGNFCYKFALSILLFSLLYEKNVRSSQRDSAKVEKGNRAHLNYVIYSPSSESRYDAKRHALHLRQVGVSMCCAY